MTRATADGAFATDRWKAGDYFRERFTLVVPVGWRGRGDAIAIGLAASDATGGRWKPTGAALAAEPFAAVLGALPVGSSADRRP